jgi:hypothetical protein
MKKQKSSSNDSEKTPKNNEKLGENQRNKGLLERRKTEKGLDDEDIETKDLA